MVNDEYRPYAGQVRAEITGLVMHQSHYQVMDIANEYSALSISYSIMNGEWYGTDNSYGDINGAGHQSGEEDEREMTTEYDCEIWFEISQTDYDGDGLSYPQELGFGTNPTLYDTDGDLICDREILYKPYLDPLVYNPPYNDYDGDNIIDMMEINSLGSNPLDSEKWAVIICGGIGGEDTMQQRSFENEIEEAHSTLTALGYDNNHIIYLNVDESRDNVDECATIFSFRRILGLLSHIVDLDDQLFLYFIDHGVDYLDEENTGHLIINDENHYFSDNELGVFFHEIHARYSVIVIDSCFSGVFLDDIARGYRIVITSCTANEEAFPDPFILSQELPLFSHAFFQSIAEGNSVEIAFYDALVHAEYIAVEAPAFHQHPQIDDRIPGEVFL